MAEEKQIKLKYIPTGNVFTLPKEEATRIYIEDKGFNYEVVDGEIDYKKAETETTTVYNQIVEETTEETQGGENETNSGETEGKEKTLAEHTVPELKAKLDTLGIKYPKNAKKDELIALFKDDGTETTEETQGE